MIFISLFYVNIYSLRAFIHKKNCQKIPAKKNAKSHHLQCCEVRTSAMSRGTLRNVTHSSDQFYRRIWVACAVSVFRFVAQRSSRGCSLTCLQGCFVLCTAGPRSVTPVQVFRYGNAVPTFNTCQMNYMFRRKAHLDPSRSGYETRAGGKNQ